MMNFVFVLFLLPFVCSDEIVVGQYATINYTLWIGSLPEDNTLLMHNVKITAPVGTTFYDVMNRAANQSVHYRFTTKDYYFSHYVTEIGGWTEIPAHRVHWMIYKLPSLPDPWNTPSDDFLSPVGVDDIHINDGENYLFWFHKLKVIEH